MRAFILVFLFGPFVNAQTPCQADIEKFCSTIKPGRPGTARCLAAKYSELSTSCKIQRERLRESMKFFAHSCKGDIDQFCPDVVPGDGRLLNCLTENRQQLSEECEKEFVLMESKKMKKEIGTKSQPIEKVESKNQTNN